MKKRLKILTIIAIAVLIPILFIATTNVRSARLESRLSVYENLVTPTTSTFIEINGLNEVVNYLPGGSRTDVTHVWADTVLGDGTIDLTSLTNSLGESLDLTGDVIVAAKFLLPDSSGATCTISQGASNAYPLLGSTFSFQLKANQSLLFKADTVLIPVASGAKTIDYDASGTTVPLFIILLSADDYQ